MKKKWALYCLSFTFIIAIIYFYYVNRLSYIHSQTWRYTDGGYFGDILTFNNETMGNKRLVKNEDATGKVIFCFGSTLLVKNIITKETGYYDKINIDNN